VFLPGIEPRTYCNYDAVYYHRRNVEMPILHVRIS
jgi:hypothetical protein